MLDSPVVPCFVEIGSMRLHFFQSLAMSPALRVKASLTSIPIMNSWFSLVRFVMNSARCVIVSEAMLSLSNLS